MSRGQGIVGEECHFWVLGDGSIDEVYSCINSTWTEGGESRDQQSGFNLEYSSSTRRGPRQRCFFSKDV